VEAIAAKHRNGVVAVVTHGDVIRLVLAHYAGIHIDLFHRLVADAGSVTAVALSDGPPRILRVNETGTLTDLVPPRPRRPRPRRVRG
jgi:broad specificity phosphatase PhoE